VKKIPHNLSCMQGKWLQCCAAKLKWSYISAAWGASGLEGLVGTATRAHGQLVANLAGLAQRWIPMSPQLLNQFHSEQRVAGHAAQVSSVLLA
jgi:hypothetical protein